MLNFNLSCRSLLTLTSFLAVSAQIGNAFAQPTDNGKVEYRVSFEDAQSHYVHVAMEIDSDDSGALELFLPVWTPGSYLVREYARHFDSVSATDAEGQPLAIEKTSKNVWTVTTPEAGRVLVRYRVYCNELTVRTNFVDAEFAVLNGAATFLTCESQLDRPHEVTLKLRSDWKQSVSSLPKPSGSSGHQFLAKDYDELVDSPILAGNPSVHPFQVAGVTHYLVNQGGDGFWDGDAAAADAAKIVEEHQRMWGVVPYDRYYFLNLIAESGGGLEHNNSTLLLTSRWNYRNKKNYKRWLGLVSHEFFHAWNVRRLRPKALAEYDYVGENYFSELWVAEGVTSYYDDLGLVRAGLTTPKEYISALSGQIVSLQSTPGRTKQSLAESSHDAWIKYYRPDENSRNTSISYYNKGAVAAFLLDANIRRLTENEKSLDDVMRELYTRFAEHGGYTNADVLQVVNEVSGSDMTEWFQSAILSTDELDYDAALEWLGLQFKSSNKEKEGAAEEESSANGTPWLGLSATSKDGLLTISGVVEGSPAFKAGLNVDDEVIGVNGYRVTSGLDDRLSQYQVGEQVEFTISRRNKILSIKTELVNKPEESLAIEMVKKPSEQQSASLAAWLHQEISEPTPAPDKDEAAESTE